jgi:hypothetical protein
VEVADGTGRVADEVMVAVELDSSAGVLDGMTRVADAVMVGLGLGKEIIGMADEVETWVEAGFDGPQA